LRFCFEAYSARELLPGNFTHKEFCDNLFPDRDFPDQDRPDPGNAPEQRDLALDSRTRA
jgi:hypothetical protein